MSDDLDPSTTETFGDLPVESALDALKRRADIMGVKYHSNIGLDKLQERIDEVADSPSTINIVTESEGATPMDKSAIARQATKLVRVRITCMNPNKKEWDGEIFSVGNSFIRTMKKFVPFGVEWHVPSMMLTMIEGRKCQVFHTVTDPNSRQKKRVGKLVKEYAVEILPDLTQAELDQLAQRQAMAGGTAAA